jgi:hypothetical protein
MGEIAAIAKGNWVASYSDIGQVKDVNPDGTLGIVVYERDGTKIGRKSPALDGPVDFEPCCDPDSWKKIEKPEFPLSRYCYIPEVVKYI